MHSNRTRRARGRGMTLIENLVGMAIQTPAADALLDLPAGDTAFLRDLIETVQSLVREFGLERGGYRLIANGGAYQEVPHLHFHLVSDEV